MHFLVKNHLYNHFIKYNYIFSFYFNMRNNNGQDLYENFMTVDKGIVFMNDNINGLKSHVINLQENIDRTKIDPNKIFNELNEKQVILEKNKLFIHNKMKVLEGRNRMLQISMDKNIFYKKVVYVLLAVVISILIIILFALSFFRIN